VANFFDIIKSDIPVLVDFSAEWCGPCKMMPPILKEVKNQLGDKVKVIKIDVDKNQAIAQKLQIRGVPTLVIYKNGEQKFRQSGVIQAPQLVQLLQPYIS
jgi:thioredoxin 1